MSTNNWPLINLKTITTKIGSGATPRGGQNSYKETGITLIRSLNVYDFQFEYDGLAFIDNNQADELNNVEVREKDILLNITGALVARCCMVPKKLLPARVNQHVAIVRVNSELADPHFVLNVINSPRYKTHLLTIAQGGATREALTKEKIENFEIPFPPLPVQHKIADVLSAYDDLIEVNTRRIRILEQMAQSVYREWFGKVDTKSLPRGWELAILEDALILQRGFDLPKQDRKVGNIPIYASTGITGTHIDAKVKGPGVVTGRSGSLGTVIYIEEDYWPLNTTLWVKEFRRVTPLYAYYLLKDLDFSQFNSGAAVPTLNRNDVHGLPVVIPSKDILSEFDEFVLPLYGLRRNLTMKNANLRRTRDLLLPRLVSGEIAVHE